MAVKKGMGSKSFIGKNKGLILQDTDGKDMNPEDYFFMDGTEAEAERIKKTGTIAPPYFNDVCGKPVDREDLVEVMNEVFNPKDHFLFYRCIEKEVYIVIFPLKFSEVSKETGALSGDCQKHAVSFVMEGSANVDTLRLKLQRIAKTMGYTRNRN